VMLFWSGLTVPWLLLLTSPLPTAIIAGTVQPVLVPWFAVLTVLA